MSKNKIVKIDPNLEKLKKDLRDAAVALLEYEGDYYYIEDEITEAILIVDDKSVYCDIHG